MFALKYSFQKQHISFFFALRRWQPKTAVLIHMGFYFIDYSVLGKFFIVVALEAQKTLSLL